MNKNLAVMQHARKKTGLAIIHYHRGHHVEIDEFIDIFFKKKKNIL